jgi:hypothetical protein
MSEATRNPVRLVINRPHGEPSRLRLKGKPAINEAGGIGLSCKDEKNRQFWLEFDAELVKQMAGLLSHE